LIQIWRTVGRIRLEQIHEFAGQKDGADCGQTHRTGFKGEPRSIRGESETVDRLAPPVALRVRPSLLDFERFNGPLDDEVGDLIGFRNRRSLNPYVRSIPLHQ
jgi:hypothetical protein